MKARISRAIVAVVLFVGGLGAWRAAAPQNDGAYRITADIAQAPNLFENGRVMVRGVEVGTITDVEPRPDAVRVTMEIDGDVDVPADARLAVVPITVIADRYVQLFPAYRSGPTLSAGDHIPLDRTDIPAELDDVLTQLQGLLSALEPGEGRRGPLARLIRNLDVALEGHSEDLSTTLKNSATVLDNLASSESDVRRLIRNLDRLFVALANRSADIELTNERLALVMQALWADQESLEGTIENLAFLADEASLLVAESGDDLGASFGRLDRVLGSILSQQDQVMAAVRWTNVIAQALGATDASGRGRFAYTGRRAKPGTPGAAYNYRLETRDTVGCERIAQIVDALLALNPEATPEQIRGSIMVFIPDEYDDDLTYLVDLLIPLCAEIELESEAASEPEPVRIVRAIAAEVGEQRFDEMLSRWFVEGFEPEIAP